MDINGLSSAYTEYISNTVNSSSGLKTSDINSKNYANMQDDELMEACKQFEAYFIEQVYKEMEKTIPKSEFSSGSTSSLVDYYKTELIQDISEQTSEQGGGLGLAQDLYEQMKRNYNL
ncbi:MAG: rod-binding protein [Lachnospiraceae bacterium]|nr:rod-binding protein [Lachnospiraceae bacterium]